VIDICGFIGIIQPEGALRARRRRAETLVESAYGASQHLNYYAHRNSTIYCGIEVLGFYCPYPRCCYPLVSSGGEFQMFPPTAGAPAAPPPAGLYY